jgi:dTDP-L-rhamnose 4-epimerase
MYSGACRIFSLSYYFNKPPVVYEDGMMMRDFINVHDVVDANILAMLDERTDYQAYCVGGGKAYSVKEFAEIVASEFGKKNLKPLITGEYRFGDTRNAVRYFQIKSIGWSKTLGFRQCKSIFNIGNHKQIEDIQNSQGHGKSQCS